MIIINIQQQIQFLPLQVIHQLYFKSKVYPRTRFFQNKFIKNKFNVMEEKSILLTDLLLNNSFYCF
jgi:hypothetical protein